MRMRHFTDSDWDGFSGAHVGPDGEQPMIGEATSADGQTMAIVVADIAGLEVFLTDAEGNPKGSYLLNEMCTVALLQLIASALPEAVVTDPEQLARFGFVRAL